MAVRPEDYGLTDALVREIEASESRRSSRGGAVMGIAVCGSLIAGFLIGLWLHGVGGLVTGFLIGGMIAGVVFVPFMGIAALLTMRKHPRLRDYHRFKQARAAGSFALRPGGSAEPKDGGYDDMDGDGGE